MKAILQSAGEVPALLGRKITHFSIRIHDDVPDVSFQDPPLFVLWDVPVRHQRRHDCGVIDVRRMDHGRWRSLLQIPVDEMFTRCIHQLAATPILQDELRRRAQT